MMTKAKKKYIIYGFLAVLILAASYWGFMFLKGTSLFKATNTYNVVYNRVDGLNLSSSVNVNGYKIGQVSDIILLPDKDCHLLVKFDIDDQYQIPSGTIARIESLDLMGTKGIELVFGDEPGMLSAGDTLIGEVEHSLKDQVSIQMLPIKRQAEDLMAEMKKAVTIITYIFNEETRANLEKSFASVKNTVANLERSTLIIDTVLSGSSNKIADIIDNVRYISAELRANSKNLDNIFSNLKTFTDTLTAVNITETFLHAKNAVDTFTNILKNVNNGSGSIGKLFVEDSLATEIAGAARNIKDLLHDFQVNPKKYINFSLINIGRTVNVTDESELTDHDRRALERRRKKLERQAQRHQQNDRSAVENPTFMIQIKSTVNQIDTHSDELKGYNNVVEKYIDGRYKYFVYPYHDPQQTDYFLSMVRADFPDAFPVAFYGNVLTTYTAAVLALNE